MKTAITLKEFCALSFDAGKVATILTPANSRSQAQGMSKSVCRFAARQAKAAETFREMLHRRETTPLTSAIPYRHFGINE